MIVRVLLFGPERNAAGADSVAVEVAAGVSCGGLRTAISSQHPALRPFLRAGRFAVNREFAAEDRPVGAGDEVALIGLVSGG